MINSVDTSFLDQIVNSFTAYNKIDKTITTKVNIE